MADPRGTLSSQAAKSAEIPYSGSPIGKKKKKNVGTAYQSDPRWDETG